MSTRKYNLARAHNISLPSTKRKLNIDEATSALSSMGYRMGGVRHSLADKTSYWSVTTPTGSVVEVAANKLTDFVYGKIKNLNAQRYTETTYEVLFPDEDEDTQFIDSKEAAIKIARQYAAKGCTVELSQVIKTWRSKAEADAAQIPTNTNETPMRFVKNLNAQRYTDELIRSLLPFEQEQIRNEGYKVYEVEICMPKSGCNHYETVAAKDFRDAVRIGKAHAKGMKFNGVTKVNAKELHMKSINKRLSSMVINELNHALEMAESDGEQGIAREVRAVLASPTVETLKAHPLAIKEIKYKLEIALDNPEDRNRVRAYENLLKSVSNRMAKSTCAAARQHFARVGARSRFAVRHPSVSGTPIDPYATKVPILLNDKTTVTAVRNDGRWSIEGRPDMPTSRKFEQLIAELNAAGFSRVGAKGMNSKNLDPNHPNNFVSLFREKYLDDINKLLEDINQPKIFLPNYTSRSQIRNDLDDLMESATDAGISIPRRIEEAYESARLGHFSRVGAKVKNTFRNFEDPSVMLSELERQLQYPKSSDKEWQFPALLKTIEKLAKSDNIHPNSDFWNRLRAANAEVKRLSYSRVGAKAKFDQTETINKILTWYQKLIKMEKRELVDLYDQKMQRGRVESKSDIREMQKPWMAVDIIRTQFRESEVQAAFNASPSGKPLRHARVGAKAKFGEVENLLNMISDQMNSGNNDLAKTNLRKLAAKIGEIRHTRSEWDQFMTVAKSLGFTESQIGGFSRRGLKIANRSNNARTGAKATHAQVNIESGGVGSYYNAHLKDPRGTGSWAFIAPDGSIVRVPGTMSLSAAKSWLKQNATISGYYKVAP